MITIPLAFSLAILSPAFSGGVTPISTQETAVVPGELPDGAVAEINGQPLTEDAYKQWLYSRKGRFFLTEYVDEILLERAAGEEGIVITDDEIEQAFQTEWSEYVQRRFRGDEGLYIKELERSGRTFEDYRKERLAQIRLDLISEELIRLRRDPSDEELHRLFEQEYGPDGLRRHLRVAFFDKYPVPPAGGQRPSPQDYQKIGQQCLERAEAFVKEVRSGRDFAEEVGELSDDFRPPIVREASINYKELGGEIQHCKLNMLGREVEMALGRLGAEPEPGTTTDVIDARRGAYVIQVIRFEKVTFENERQRLLATFLQRPAQPGEKHLLKQSLKEKAKIRKRLEFGRSP